MGESGLEFPSVSIYGLPVSKMGRAQTVEYLTRAVERRVCCQVVTVNPIMVMAALNRPDFMRAMKQADLIVPDGTGVVWAARYVGNPVSERVAGFDLMHDLLEAGQLRGWRVYLLGASPDVVRAANESLTARYPGVRFEGLRIGYFSAEQDGEVIGRIREAAPDLLFVARSMEGQEPWIAKHRGELNIPVMMGVGGSFDVISGKLKRAPRLFQKLRLEWFYRLLQEPWRFRRMLDLPKFVFKVMRDKEHVQNN